jgi:quercetin dioxygenase-like cupin family protein
MAHRVVDQKGELSAVYYKLDQLDFVNQKLAENVTVSGWIAAIQGAVHQEAKSVTSSVPNVTRIHFHKLLSHVSAHSPCQQCFYAVVSGNFSVQANGKTYLMNPGDVLYLQPDSVIQQICCLHDGPEESMIYVISNGTFNPSFESIPEGRELEETSTVWQHKIDGIRFWTDNSGDFPVKIDTNWSNFLKKKYNMANRVEMPPNGSLGAHHHPNGAIYIAMRGKLFYGGDYPDRDGVVEQFELRWVRPERYYGPESTDGNGALFLALHPGYLQSDQWMTFHAEKGEENEFIPPKKGLFW